MSLDYQIQYGKPSDYSWEKMCEAINIDPELVEVQTQFMKDISTAYRYGINKGFEQSNRYIILGCIAERFFNQVHMHRAITMNIEKVKEALELISAFSTAGANNEDWMSYQDRIIEKMKDWK